METEDRINRIRERVSSNYPYLHISRIPSKTYDEFISFAKKDYCGDYGMALKFLWDFFKGIIPTGIEHLEIIADNHEERIKILEQKETIEQSKIKKRLG